MNASEIPAQDRTLAAANHVASIFFPFVGPVVFYFIGRSRSQFVAYHALIALFETIFLKLWVMVIGVISLSITLTRVAELIRTNGQSFTWDLVWQAALKALFLWVAFWVLGIVLGIRSLFQAQDAYEGKRDKGFASALAHRFTDRIPAQISLRP